jgi:hypothetical protein
MTSKTGKDIVNVMQTLPCNLDRVSEVNFNRLC